MARADLEKIVKARRDNYRTLAARIHPPRLIASVLPALAARISPLAYPVSVPDRSSHDLRLRQRDVPVWTFGSTLHRVLFEAATRDVLDDAVHLRDTLLLVSVHHMLGTDDMEEYASTINSYCAEDATCAPN